MGSNVLDRDGNTDDGDDELADSHTSSTDEEKGTATELLNTPHTRQSHEHIDNASSDGNQEGVADAGALEEGGAVVEDEVDYASCE